MRFEDRLKKSSNEQLWHEYCGFLDMSLEEYMFIQRRLMVEQLAMWRKSGLGRLLLKGKNPTSLEELRELLPLTTYEDYADVLLARRADMLCSEPSAWIQTTWEGGLRPVKVAPYTRSMLDTYRHNLIATVLMGSARKKGDIRLKPGQRVLYGGAPLPYATGLMPSVFDEDIHLDWLPDANENSDLSFSQRIKKGFEMALGGGLDYFFGLGSVANCITERFSQSSGGSHRHSVSPGNAIRYLKSKYVCHRDGRRLNPGDIFRLKGFFYAGTDAACYKDRLTRAWGVMPVEIAAGTESTCLGSETWEHSGMVFFPDACFYEFIPKSEMYRNMQDPAYQPRTCLMDEIQNGETYELVISVFHGGAFMRYRIGDMYRCVSGGSGQLPRLSFVDRVPSVIDIAGFTRITKESMEEVIKLSRLELGDWVMKKEFNQNDDPFLHFYVEIPPDVLASEVATRAVLTEHLSCYFKYFDSDYGDLKKLLNMEPLEITILKFGSIAAYEKRTGARLSRINPGMLDINDLLRMQDGSSQGEGRIRPW